jgi:ankyrin repeat protein
VLFSFRGEVSIFAGFRKFPLLLYANYCWLKHLLLVEVSISTQTKDLVLQFLASKPALLSWIQIYNPEEYDGPFESTENYDVGSPLYYLAHFGCCNLIQYFISRGSEVNTQGGNLGTALQAAAYKGHINTVKLLLEAGGDINVHAGHFGTALQVAACRGELTPLEILLKAGANCNLPGGTYGNALNAACYWRNVVAVKKLLEAGADVNATDEPHGTAIQATLLSASLGPFEDRAEIIKALQTAGAETSEEDIAKIQALREKLSKDPVS